MAGSDVLVEWSVSTHVNMFGSNLYRGESPDGERVQLNEALIETSGPPGSASPASWEFVDDSVVGAMTYYCWLEVFLPIISR